MSGGEDIREGVTGRWAGHEDEDVVRQDPGRGPVGEGDPGPWHHEEGNEYHGERATLWDGGGLVVVLAQCAGNAVVDLDVLVISPVCREDGGWHTSSDS